MRIVVRMPSEIGYNTRWKDVKSNLNHIEAYVHCSMCLEEWEKFGKKYPNEYEGIYPDDWANIKNEVERDKRAKEYNSFVRNGHYDFGWTKWGLQVWCPVHNVNIIHIDFEDMSHPADTTKDNTWCK